MRPYGLLLAKGARQGQFAQSHITISFNFQSAAEASIRPRRKCSPRSLNEH